MQKVYHFTSIALYFLSIHYLL